MVLESKALKLPSVDTCFLGKRHLQSVEPDPSYTPRMLRTLNHGDPGSTPTQLKPDLWERGPSHNSFRSSQASVRSSEGWRRTTSHSHSARTFCSFGVNPPAPLQSLEAAGPGPVSSVGLAGDGEEEEPNVWDPAQREAPEGRHPHAAPGLHPARTSCPGAGAALFRAGCELSRHFLPTHISVVPVT